MGNKTKEYDVSDGRKVVGRIDIVENGIDGWNDDSKGGVDARERDSVSGTACDKWRVD
jgi:hypothetical protein